MRGMFLRLAAAIVFGSLTLKGTEFICAETGRAEAAPVDSPAHRKYAPERHVDMLHLSVDVTPDFHNQSITGETKLRFRTLTRPVPELRLNASDLRVKEV